MHIGPYESISGIPVLSLYGDLVGSGDPRLGGLWQRAGSPIRKVVARFALLSFALLHGCLAALLPCCLVTLLPCCLAAALLPCCFSVYFAALLSSACLPLYVGLEDCLYVSVEPCLESNTLVAIGKSMDIGEKKSPTGPYAYLGFFEQLLFVTILE